MQRNFTRENQDLAILAALERKKVGVVSMGAGSGGTFIAMALAQQLVKQRESVAFLELRKGSPGRALSYDSIGINKRFSMKRYEHLFFRIKNKKGVKTLRNQDSGINWGLMTPEENQSEITLSLAEKLHLVHNMNGDFVLCDLGTEYDENLLREMDVLFCVVDPMPSKLMANKEMFLALNSYKEVIWVENKSNPGIMKRSFLKYMRRKIAYRIPLMAGELFYRKEYNCRLPYEQREIEKIIQPIVEDMVNHHIIHKNG